MSIANSNGATIPLSYQGRSHLRCGTTTMSQCISAEEVEVCAGGVGWGGVGWGNMT
jgi:hypothetical protein